MSDWAIPGVWPWLPTRLQIYKMYYTYVQNKRHSFLCDTQCLMKSVHVVVSIFILISYSISNQCLQSKWVLQSRLNFFDTRYYILYFLVEFGPSCRICLSKKVCFLLCAWWMDLCSQSEDVSRVGWLEWIFFYLILGCFRKHIKVIKKPLNTWHQTTNYFHLNTSKQLLSIPIKIHLKNWLRHMYHSIVGKQGKPTIFTGCFIIYQE